MVFRILFTFLVFQSITSLFAQTEPLTAEERAYLFHIVRKSPILENNIGRFFEYKGSEIKFSNGKINYDSTEIQIINNPSLLIIYTNDIRKAPIGLIAEAANKVAIWELNKILLAKRSKNNEEFAIYQSKYDFFEELLISKLPKSALKNDSEIHPKIEQLLNPSLHLNDKIKMVETFHFLTENEQLSTLNTINYAINEYIKKRAYEIFSHLGGQTYKFENILVAAGDGSLTSGLLEEREKDENGRWNKGLPKAIGLFPYQLKLNPTKQKDISPIQPARYTENGFYTYGNNTLTNIHLDVWGYNSDKQTTVVIEKNGKTYHLFGSGETRFLSPDSTFAKGATYQQIIDDLKIKISKIDEKIYGKKGYDYWIAVYEKKRDDLKAQILELEQNIANISSFKINTKQNGVITANKDVDKTQSDKKNRKEAQNSYIDKNEQLEAAKRKIKELQKEKEEALARRTELDNRMNKCIAIFGRNWVQYTENNGIYTYADSTTFNMNTQEFTFLPTKDTAFFEVRLIAIPNTSLSEQADEVMMHINVTYANPEYNAKIQLHLQDVFESNSWKLNNPLLKEEDSLSIRIFLEQLADKKKPFYIITRGNGIGQWNGTRTDYKSEQTELDSYTLSKNDSTYKRLRTSEAFAYANHSLQLEINSFTDPVRSTFDIQNPKIMEYKSKSNLTYNQLLSAYRSAAILFQLQTELTLLAGTYFNREKANIIIDRLNTTINNAKILVGKTSIKASYFK